MKRGKQESIRTAFTRQQKPTVKRPKRAATASASDSASASPSVLASATDVAVVTRPPEEEDYADKQQQQQQRQQQRGYVVHSDGSATDEDVCSSQEEATAVVTTAMTAAHLGGEEQQRGQAQTDEVRHEHEEMTTGDHGADVAMETDEEQQGHVKPVGIRLHLRKEVKDSVHGMISFEPLCWRIIDTRQFQRLRHLHQLGAARYVYVGATHSRFEHCLGVAYLAERLVQTLRLHQPYLPITDRDMLCIKVAGLCHDLGHGPFSHVFDGIYMKQMQRRRPSTIMQSVLTKTTTPSARSDETNNQDDSVMDTPWTHERGSLDMFDHLLRANSIDLEEKHDGIPCHLERNDVTFIKELIYGGPLPGNTELHGRRDASQQFLYDIVNNAKSGLDVDKLDYFLRDARHTGVKAACDVELLIKNARVLPDRNDAQRRLSICFPEKLAGEVMQAFRTRFQLHQSVYQHKNIRAAEYMISDALLAADEHVRIKGRRISEIVHYMDAYQHLDDRVLARIEESDDESLRGARRILDQVAMRPFYVCVGKTAITPYSQQKNEEILLDEILRCSTLRSLVQERDNVVAEVVRVHFGKGAQNPLQFVRFYAKAATSESKCFPIAKEAYQMHLPASFQETFIRLFVKERRLVAPVREAFKHWSKKFNKSHVISNGPEEK